VVDRYTVKFVLKEPYVWLLDMLATSKAMWIIAREVVEKFGDLKKPESVIGTGPFLLERYEPNVKTVFKRHPEYFLKDQRYVAGWVRGEPTGAVARGLHEWSLPVDQLGAGAKYYQYDPKEAKRLLAEAGFPNGFKTQLHATGGFGPDLLDAVQLVQRYLKDVG